SNDATRSRQRRALDAVEAHAAAADHGHGAARLDPGRAEHGADARRHAAPDEGGTVERHLVIDLHHAVLVHQQLLGEGAEPGELVWIRTSRGPGSSIMRSSMTKSPGML